MNDLKTRVRARLDALGMNAFEAARRMGDGVSRDYVFDILKGRKKTVRGDNLDALAAALECTPAFLTMGDTREPGQAALVRVIGSVGASSDGAVLQATGDNGWDFVPVPPGGTRNAVALRVEGHSMGYMVEEGGLIYFEDQQTPPTNDMIGRVVVVETVGDHVLVKRLLRGSAPGLYDLESIVGPMLPDVRLRWAAHITAIIPALQARRLTVHQTQSV